MPVLLFSLSPNKTIRFLLPILPAFSLIIIQEIFNSPLFQRVKKAYCYALVGIAVVQYAFLNCGFLNTYKQQGIDHLNMGILSVQNDQYLPASLRLLEVFKKEAASSKGLKKTVFFFSSLKGPISCHLSMSIGIYQLPFNVVYFSKVTFLDKNNLMMASFEKDLAAAESNIDYMPDYIIDKTSTDAYPGYQYLDVIMRRTREVFNKYINQYKMIAAIKMHDDSGIYVYKKMSGRDTD